VSADHDDDGGWWAHYLRGIGVSARNNTIAYGYSVVITASFAAVAELEGAPGIASIFLYLVGATIAFAAINALITKGYRRRLPSEPGVVLAMATAFSIFSAGVGAGAAALVAWLLPASASWTVAGFASSVAYILAVGAETAVAAKRHELGGVDD
jgi:hypothetical protein